MSVTLSALLDAPEDILHEWFLAVCFPLPGRQRCFIAAGLRRLFGFFVILSLLPLIVLHEKHVVHIVFLLFVIMRCYLQALNLNFFRSFSFKFYLVAEC